VPLPAGTPFEGSSSTRRGEFTVHSLLGHGTIATVVVERASRRHLTTPPRCTIA
jgi:hypothetical protein